MTCTDPVTDVVIVVVIEGFSCTGARGSICRACARSCNFPAHDKQGAQGGHLLLVHSCMFVEPGYVHPSVRV